MNERMLEFVAEGEELMDEASALLLEIQESLPSPQPDLVNGVFRAMHTLKGMAGLFGLQGLSDISHHLENILDMIRLGRVEVDIATTSFVFKCFDVIRGIMNEVRDSGGEDSSEVSSVLAEIEAFMENLANSAVASAGDIVIPDKYKPLLNILSEYEEHRLKINIQEGKAICLIKATFPLEEFDVLLKQLTEKIKPVGEVVSTMPTSEGIPEGSIGFQILTASSLEADGIVDICGCGVETLVSVRGKDQPPVKGVESAPRRAQESDQMLRSSSTTIRVDISKVDSILDTIADLSLSKQAVHNIWQSLSAELGGSPIAIDLYRVSQTMQRRLELLQSQVLEIRMIPVGHIFSRLDQVVRRYSTSAGKHIRLELYGEDTEIDKYVAEEVVDPLMHAVRNSIDHGIEDSDARVSLGKPPEGLVELKAFQKGNNVIISIKDDGRGIDPEKIRLKAVEKGLISESEVLDRREMLELLFRPGFSTAEQVSETSGRGVGLDVVKEKMSTLGGAVEVSDEIGVGTTFIFTLPITLSLIRALIVKASDEIFAVPLTSMSETFVVDRDEVQEVEGGLVYDFRGEMLPMSYLGDLLMLEDRDHDRHFVIIIGHGDRRMGLMTDEFLGQQEIVIKPMGGYFEGVKGYAGASEIGRHKVILVLDTETLINEALQKRKIPG